MWEPDIEEYTKIHFNHKDNHYVLILQHKGRREGKRWQKLIFTLSTQWPYIFKKIELFHSCFNSFLLISAYCLT